MNENVDYLVEVFELFGRGRAAQDVRSKAKPNAKSKAKPKGKGTSRISVRLAVHASIGASGRHLLRGSLAEAVVLAVVGGLASLPVAAAILRGIQAMLPVVEAGSGFDIELDSAVLAFAAAATLATALLFGSIPAINAMRTDPGLVVKGQASQAASGPGMTRFRGSLATAQVALSMLLLALAGLFTQSLMNVARVNLGMNIDSLVTFSVSPRLNGYGPERTMNVFDRLEEALAAAPGVSAVAQQPPRPRLAAAAGYLPARRAARIAPMEALRYE